MASCGRTDAVWVVDAPDLGEDRVIKFNADTLNREVVCCLQREVQGR